jgi:hypothetical protein
MKLTKSERKEMAEPAMAEESYPWGLRLTLDKETLDKLGIDGLPAVGTKMLLVARAEVKGVSQHESDDHESRSVDLQITEMGVESEKAKRDLATSLYPGEDA